MKVKNFELPSAKRFVMMVGVLLMVVTFIFPFCAGMESGYVMEEHYIIDIMFKSETGSSQPILSNFKQTYDIVLDTGEIVSTNIDNLELQKKYKMQLCGYVVNFGVNRCLKNIHLGSLPNNIPNQMELQKLY